MAMADDAAAARAADSDGPHPAGETGRSRAAAEATSAEGITRWLLTSGVKLTSTAMFDGVAWRLRAAGMPLDRFTCSVRLLSASVLAASVVWRPFRPLAFRRLDYENRDRGDYERSPLKAAHDRGGWLDVDLAATPDDAYGIVPELKEEGLSHYTVVPMVFSDGSRNSLTLATKSPEGFSAEHRRLVAEIMPALGAALEIKTQERTLREVLSTYVGRGPAERIVAGTTHRGEITRLRAAILVADLRGFTWLSTQMPPESTADLLNRYYDVVVPPIREAGGEVLKFIGDAVLAIFPEDVSGDRTCCIRALKAAEGALADGEPTLPVAGVSHEIRFGIALHVGEVVYGNVGSGDRLDFTVVGRDVNVAARISSLCSTLGRPLLVSRDFADALGADLRRFLSVGAHPVRGLSEKLEVLKPCPGEPGDGPPEVDNVSVGPVLM